MTCSLCTATALNVVGKKGFCKAHRTEAEVAMKLANKSTMGRGVFIVYPRKEAS